MSFGWLKSNERGMGRRAFLGGAGTVVALPFLESLIPRTARAQAAGSPKRLLYYYVPNGVHMPAWKPTTPGAAYAITPILKALEPLKADFMIVSGLNNAPARPMPGPGDHAAGTAGFLTAASALKSASQFRLGISVDQIAATALMGKTRVPSVQLGIEGGALAGSCDSGFGCPYARSISWSGPTTPMPKVTDPKIAFDLMFQGFDPGASQVDTAKRTFYKKSVLDVAAGRAETLKTRLGASDRKKLDEYLTGVRETERQVSTATPGGGAGGACGTPPADVAVTMDFDKHVKVMSDIMVMAMQCDVSRVFTFMLGNAGGQHVYNNLGINRGHHDISHHGGNANNQMMLQSIATYEIQLLAYLLTKMKATTDEGGDLLFNSTVFLSSEISDGDRHNHDDMPVLIAGHGGGLLNTGQHYILPMVKFSNMLVSTLRTVGVMDATLGDSTGFVAEVLKA